MAQRGQWESENVIESYFEHTVLRWIRRIVARQADAYFKFVGQNMISLLNRKWRM
ncbi:hypothetical protein F442_16698 [Phytophthora nicotianae P10297]|uniref:Uncharacterized protein n=1 Tax=Phytophthora nicotianae P10297 TaxID=1317064 RepID=W2YJS7_PHYNI|nr:hypothetical protein F442_16698 [Phytophthora nicotianae P10297]